MQSFFECLKSCSTTIKDVLTPIALFLLIWRGIDYLNTKRKLYQKILDLVEDSEEEITKTIESQKPADIVKFNKEDQ